MQNPYLPYPVRIDEIITETEDKNLKTFKLIFLNPDDKKKFSSYMPGQFAELSVAGKGEIPIGIASSPTEKGFLKFTVNKVGLVTTCLHSMKAGDIIGVRGPLGRHTWDILKGKNIVIIGGGFAFTTLRSSIVYMLDPLNRMNFKEIHVIYGSRSPGMLLYRDELAEWETRDDINMHITVDGTDDPDWKYNVGFVPTITEQKAPPGNSDTYALICGPPIMIKFTQPVLDKLGYTHNHIIMSLEMRMKCGIGICGRCNIGEKYVCKDGPIFTLAELNNMPKEY